MRTHVLLGVAVVLALGCGGSKKFAPVSGTVTLGGKPLSGATVTFIPIANPGSIEAGDSSVGKTNEKGGYTLTSSTGKNGAQVGKHKVSISIQETRGEGDRSITIEKLPKSYNAETELTCDVPAGGTDKADFDLKSDSKKSNSKSR
jgi:hypothetical protein